MNPAQMQKIAELAGPRVKEASDPVVDGMIADLVKGAQRNPGAQVQMDEPGYEQKLASAGLSPLTVAEIAGALSAYGEAEFTLKQASEAMKVPEDVLQAVLAAVK